MCVRACVPFSPPGRNQSSYWIMDSRMLTSCRASSSPFAALGRIEIAKLRGVMSKQDLEKLMHTFISSRVDYCNGIFTGLPKKTTKQLELIQNEAAKVLKITKRTDHVTLI